MESENSHQKEFIKSKFRCPLCGNLAGCDADGNTSQISDHIFREHVDRCRSQNRVKPGRIRYSDAD